MWTLFLASSLTIGASVPAVGSLVGLALLMGIAPASEHYSLNQAMGWVAHADRPRTVTDLVVILQLALLWFASIAVYETVSLIACVVITLGFVIGTNGWDYLTRISTRAHGNRLTIYYDRDCGFCHKICLIFRTFLLLGDTRVVAAQSNATAYALMQQHDSWVVYDGPNTYFVRWRAVLHMLKRSVLTKPIGRFLVFIGMGRWGDVFYTAIAAMRGHLSKVTARLLPLELKVDQNRWPANMLAIVWATILLVSIAWSYFDHGPLATYIALLLGTSPMTQ